MLVSWDCMQRLGEEGKTGGRGGGGGKTWTDSRPDLEVMSCSTSHLCSMWPLAYADRPPGITNTGHLQLS